VEYTSLEKLNELLFIKSKFFIQNSYLFYFQVINYWRRARI